MNLSHCALKRDYVEGTHGGTIGYLETIYIEEGFRRKDIGAYLVCACEKRTKRGRLSGVGPRL